MIGAEKMIYYHPLQLKKRKVPCIQKLGKMVPNQFLLAFL